MMEQTFKKGDKVITPLYHTETAAGRVIHTIITGYRLSTITKLIEDGSRKYAYLDLGAYWRTDALEHFTPLKWALLTGEVRDETGRDQAEVGSR